jgi:hypothetical protein
MHRTRVIFSAARVAFAVSFCVQAAALSAQSFHFEDGNLSGWLTGGTAFSRPTDFGKQH